MTEWIDGLSVAMMFVSGLFLYAESRPIPGAITFVGGGKTEREIKMAERRRKLQRYVGLALFILGSLVQFFRVVGVLP